MDVETCGTPVLFIGKSPPELRGGRIAQTPKSAGLITDMATTGSTEIGETGAGVGIGLWTCFQDL